METVWDKANKVIQDKLSKQNFDTWIKPIKIIAMEDKCVRLAVPNKFFKDWLLDNYFPSSKVHWKIL
ncbi:MAG: DnaA N-terminal domain-containing protein [Smithellaceae bacterium]